MLDTPIFMPHHVRSLIRYFIRYFMRPSRHESDSSSFGLEIRLHTSSSTSLREVCRKENVLGFKIIVDTARCLPYTEHMVSFAGVVSLDICNSPGANNNCQLLGIHIINKMAYIGR